MSNKNFQTSKLNQKDLFVGMQVAVNDNGNWVLGIVTDLSLDKEVFEVEFNDGESYGEYYGQEDINEFGLKAVK